MNIHRSMPRQLYYYARSENELKEINIAKKTVTNVDIAFFWYEGFSSIFTHVNGFPTSNIFSAPADVNNITRVTMMTHERFGIYNQDVTSLTFYLIRSRLFDDSAISISYKSILRCHWLIYVIS